MKPVPLSNDPFNLAKYVLKHAGSHPEKIALSILGRSRAEQISFFEVEDRVLRTATGLLNHGLGPGDRVLLRLSNHVDFPIAFLAAIAVGLIPVPTAAGLTAPEITKMANIIEPKLILAHEGPALPDPLPCKTLTDFAALADTSRAEYLTGDKNRLAYLVFTSGSSGTPRAVAHAHRAILARRMMWQDWYGLTPNDRMMHAGAMNWTFTLGTGLLDPWSVGATALVPADGTPPEKLPQLIKDFDATIFAAVPGIYRKFLKSQLPHMPKLRHGLSAGEKLPDQIRKGWQDATGTEIHEALGMSECSTFISGAPRRPAPIGSLGFAQEGRSIAVVDENGAPIPTGKTGMLAIHMDEPGLMLGYWQSDGPQLPLTGNWFLTGDLVSQSADGAFYYHGRRDTVLNTGGFRISPYEVEAAFQPITGDCIAFSHEVKPGTQIFALAHTCDIAEADLRRHAETCLADFKQPRSYMRLAELPRGQTGKINPKALTALLQEAK